MQTQIKTIRGTVHGTSHARVHVHAQHMRPPRDRQVWTRCITLSQQITDTHETRREIWPKRVVMFAQSCRKLILSHALATQALGPKSLRFGAKYLGAMLAQFTCMHSCVDWKAQVRFGPRGAVNRCHTPKALGGVPKGEEGGRACGVRRRFAQMLGLSKKARPSRHCSATKNDTCEDTFS